MADTYNFSMSGLMSYSMNDQIGAPRHKAPKEPSFEEEVIQDLKEEFEQTNTNEDGFYIVTKKNGYCYYAPTTEDILRISLVPQEFLCTPLIGHFDPCTVNGVFYKENGEYKMLYRNQRFFLDKRPLYLSKNFLKEIFKKFLPKVEIKIGELSYKKTKHPAWMLTSEKGVFYIPWHNGLPIKASDALSFEEKSYEKMRYTYSILKFQEASYQSGRDYVATCG